MNMRTRLKRGTIGAMIALMIFAAGAFADTSSVDLTVGVINGTRSLSVTGVDSSTNTPSPSSAVALSFNDASTSGKLGLVVTDVLFDDIGYTVSATLSDLYKVDPTETDGFVCGSTAIVPSEAFTAGFSNLLAPSGAVAVIEPLMTFTGDASTVNSLLGTVTSTLDGVYQEVSTPEVLMGVNNGAGGKFTKQDEHPVCGGADSTGATPVVLQTGTPTDGTGLDLSGIASDLWNDARTAAGTTDSTLSVVEAIDAGLLEPTADDPGGRLFEDVEATLLSLSLTGLTVTDQLVRDVIGVLEAAQPTLDIGDLVGQSGLYQNVPELSYAEADAPDATTGIYQGRMTITLTSN